MNWNDYIESIQVSHLVHYFVPDNFSHQNLSCKIRLYIKYCCHIRSGVSSIYRKNLGLRQYQIETGSHTITEFKLRRVWSVAT